MTFIMTEDNAWNFADFFFIMDNEVKLTLIGKSDPLLQL